MKKTIITIALIGVSIAGIVFVLNKNKEKSEQATAIVAEKNANVAVRADIVDFRSVNTQYEANGTFQAKQEVALSAETQGRVIRVLVNEGSRVGAGQVLAIIKGEQQNVNVQNAQAVYNNALAEVKRFEIKQYEEQQRNNSYWQGLMQQQNRWNKDNRAGYLEAIQSLTSADVQRFANKVLLRDGNCATIIMLPKGTKQAK